MNWAISALLAAVLAGFGAYLVGLVRLPRYRRPRVPRTDRYGEPVGDKEKNPGKDIAPGRGGDPR